MQFKKAQNFFYIFVKMVDLEKKKYKVKVTPQHFFKSKKTFISVKPILKFFCVKNGKTLTAPTFQLF